MRQDFHFLRSGDPRPWFRAPRCCAVNVSLNGDCSNAVGARLGDGLLSAHPRSRLAERLGPPVQECPKVSSDGGRNRLPCSDAVLRRLPKLCGRSAEQRAPELVEFASPLQSHSGLACRYQAVQRREVFDRRSHIFRTLYVTCTSYSSIWSASVKQSAASTLSSTTTSEAYEGDF